MKAPVDLVAVRGARETIKATLQAHPEIGARTGAFFAGELQEKPMADDKMTRIRADLVDRAGEVRDKLNEAATGPWRVTQKAILEDAIRIGLDAIEQRPPVEPPALAEDRNAVRHVVFPIPAEPVAPAPRKASKPAEPDDTEPASAFLREYRKPSRMTKPATVGGALLRKWRQGEGMNQKEAAELVGIAQPSYSALETGKRPPTKPQAAKLATLTGIDPAAWTAPANGEG